MGKQRRYRRATGDGYAIPVVARSRDLDRAVERITGHLRQSGVPGIYTGAGDHPVPPVSFPDDAPVLVGDDQVQRGFSADGSDTYLLAEPGEPVEDLRDRLYRSRNYATPRMIAGPRSPTCSTPPSGWVTSNPRPPTRFISWPNTSLLTSTTKGSWARCWRTGAGCCGTGLGSPPTPGHATLTTRPRWVAAAAAHIPPTTASGKKPSRSGVAFRRLRPTTIVGVAGESRG